MSGFTGERVMYRSSGPVMCVFFSLFSYRFVKIKIKTFFKLFTVPCPKNDL